MKRRDFIKGTLAATALTTFSVPTLATNKKLKVLMLGGTNFVGPHFVNQCLRNGHEVTLFNRGETNPDLFSGLEWIKGNRFPDQGDGLKGLRGDRKWDVVIDTWQGAPVCVAQTASLLQGRVDQYIYISSIATFRNYKEHNMSEESPLLDVSEIMESFDDHYYSERKRAGEQNVKKYFPKGGTILRCGSILGENLNYNEVPTLSFYEYHFLLGKDVILPDDESAKFQLIDVKDLAAFGSLTMENSLSGDFNMVGPEQTLKWKTYVNLLHKATRSTSKIHWAKTEWLTERGIQEWSDIPNWIPMSSSEPGFYTINNKKAIDTGLAFESVYTTLVDGINNLSINKVRELKNVGGYSEETRLKLIDEWVRTNAK
ncbi:NAD-dependent epimerase/dehydratase family protein [Ekhidna sp.]|uniref:NAD-dependent epimerase/dehydratase family protein n=1 Tax=Ekhidna sp. TaxID=2608089 RepID=UPI0035178342